MGVGQSKHQYISDLKAFAAEDKPESWKQYDYVIVGGGTAGCVLASRLSEDENASVLLIEAGGDYRKELLSTIPFGWPKLPRTLVDWNFRSVEQPRNNNRRYPVPRGRVLGGTGQINALIYQPGTSEDWDEWERMGAVGFGYKDILPYLRKVEAFTPSEKYPDMKPEDHSTSGLWKTSMAKHVTPLHLKLMEGCNELGIKSNPDFNGPDGNMGTGTFTTFINPTNQSRHSTAEAYLSPEVLKRPNLTVVLKTTTEKILFDTSSADEPKAIGVQISQGPDAPKYRVAAKREVIVCAGAISTPHILLASGLGPKEELKKVGVPVVKDLSQVGKNFVDHMAGGPVFVRTKPQWTLDYLNNPVSGLVALGKWLVSGSGPMTSMVAPGAAFVRTDDTNVKFDPTPGGYQIKDTSAGPNSPDIELLWFPLITGDLSGDPPKGNGFTVGAIVLKQEGSGSITLKTPSVYDEPNIDHNTFSTENDWHIAARGLRLCLRLARTKALEGIAIPKEHSKDYDDFYWPGDADPDQITDDELRSYMEGHSLPIFHPTSTARIAPSAETGVVDARLRVFGVKGLRVCDASVLPRNVSGHPAVPVVAIAEKTADILKEDARA